MAGQGDDVAVRPVLPSDVALQGVLHKDLFHRFMNGKKTRISPGSVSRDSDLVSAAYWLRSGCRRLSKAGYVSVRSGRVDLPMNTCLGLRIIMIDP
jgi:hypothetical protein